MILFMVATFKLMQYVNRFGCETPYKVLIIGMAWNEKT